MPSGVAEVDEEHLQECLDNAAPLDRVLAQSLLNSASALAENALLLRSLLPGGQPLPLADALSPGIASKEKKPRRRKSGDAADEGPSGKRKRAPTGYLMYINSIRPEVKAQNPSLGPSAMMSSLAARWKALSEEQQKVWTSRAAAAARAGT
mmetsp:Transcript_7836/g.20479  ORF Transcript_7836/g.20479 Transcript_7836/m.20479 type:complete len:151 (-) Transcript_7836:263-715(-)|eukprot:CAMPEP_0115849882 /NCGR_PEP_ID=MMETSP0287-20121206/11679_1 /TAXON_ID=412157 /ORGANISM="Chrysochromulina rotalis, Strain UIO044" /LENGTH=150 /DNA_ID=CAMNT_0003303865 /DNA_START=36 /DNA_END=488 /DNA_ORIENTATION=-